MFYCKKIVASHENQDGDDNVYIFHPIFSKMIFLFIFLLFFYILSKNKTFMEKLFALSFKMAE
jgi:hypothetical protein